MTNFCKAKSRLRHAPSAPRLAIAGLWAASAAFLAPMTARAESVALCVGVNRYPHLRPGANLSGCVNDAHLFAQKLSVYGITHPVLLSDAEATKANILAQLAALRAKVKPGDKFIFYFAGHGTLSSGGESVLLTADAEDTSEVNDMQVADLYNAVKAFGGGVQKTIILDSCHSGGMVREGDRKWHDRRARFYVRTAKRDQKAPGFKTMRSWQEASLNGADDLSTVVHATTPAAPVPDAPPTPVTAIPVPATGGGAVCYFTAAQKNEVANETEVEGTTHGLFTYYLVKELKGKGDLWKDITATVSGQVASATDNEQKPQLYPPTLMDKVVFGGADAPTPKPFALDSVYDISNPDPTAVSLRRFPEQSPVLVGSKNYLQVTVGHDGYLVLVGRDPGNNIDILYPKTPTREAMAVHAGDSIRLPAKETAFFHPDTPGTDGLKAVLFDSPEAAEAMLKPFLAAAGETGYKSLKTNEAKRAWHDEELAPDVPVKTAGTTPTAVKPVGAVTTPESAKFFTSEITTRIVPSDEAAKP